MTVIGVVARTISARRRVLRHLTGWRRYDLDV